MADSPREPAERFRPKMLWNEDVIISMVLFILR
jgi:hypothetical protein